jgi:drug/metabolite transporter (DMT)-like permease
MAANDNLKGAALMAASMAGFTINDAMVKKVSPLMNVGEIMLLRGLMTTLLVFLIAWRLGALRPIKIVLNRMIAARMVAEALASITYLAALSMMPLSNTASILQAMPLAVTMGAALFLGEPVGWRRWAAIIVGFIGVLVIIRPGTGDYGIGSILVVLCVIFAAARDLVTRKISSDIPSLFVTVITSFTISMVGAVLIVPFGGWRPVTMEGFLPLAFGSVMLFVGYQSIIMAMRTGEVSFIAPFRYTSLLWSLVLGIFMLGEHPDVWMLTGAAIVIAAGLYTFYREAQNSRKLAAESTNPNAV